MKEFFGRIKKAALSRSSGVKKPEKKPPNLELLERFGKGGPTPPSTDWVPKTKTEEKKPNLLLKLRPDSSVRKLVSGKRIKEE
mgnify:CR=1 FL=1